MKKFILILLLLPYAFSQEKINGSRNMVNVPAPGTPVAGTTNVYVDSTSKLLCSKDDTGAVSCVGGSGSGGSVGSQFAVQYSSDGAGGFGGTTPPTLPNGVVQVVCGIPSGGVATAPTMCLPGIIPRPVNGTTSTDTIVSTDCNPTFLEYDGSVAVAITLPTSTTLAVPDCVLIGVNATTGSSTALTITPTTWTINGSSTATIAQGETFRIVNDPNSATNWLLYKAEQGLTAGSGITFTRSATGLSIAASSSGGSVTSIATTSPITGGTITTTGTIACATCVTSAASLTSNAVVIGGGSQASSTISTDTTTTHALFATGTAPAFRALATTDLPSAAKVRICDISLGDGLNAIAAATYPPVACKNDSGATITITGVQCYTDSGSSTCDAKTSHAGTPDILTGAVTGTTTFAAGTQSATTSVLNGEWLTGSLVADGTTKQIILHIIGTL